MARPLVVICALRGRLFPEVEAAVGEQYPDYAIHTDEPYPLCTYADFVRTIWAGLGDLVIVEGDSIPPPGSISRLLECDHPWCAHPSWVGDRYLNDTLGLVRFSQGLQETLPKFADSALAKPMFRSQRHNRGLEDFNPRAYLGEVEIEDSVLRVWPELVGRSRERALEPGTTAHPKAIDMRLGQDLRARGVRLHVHEPPAPHLRYLNDPAWLTKWPASLPLDQAGRAGSPRLD